MTRPAAFLLQTALPYSSFWSRNPLRVSCDSSVHTWFWESRASRYRVQQNRGAERQFQSNHTIHIRVCIESRPKRKRTHGSSGNSFTKAFSCFQCSRMHSIQNERLFVGPLAINFALDRVVRRTNETTKETAMAYRDVLTRLFLQSPSLSVIIYDTFSFAYASRSSRLFDSYNRIDYPHRYLYNNYFSATNSFCLQNEE